MSAERDLKLLPKAHLHIHLEGAMQPSTLSDLCIKYGIEHPVDTRGQQYRISAVSTLYIDPPAIAFKQKKISPELF